MGRHFHCWSDLPARKFLFQDSSGGPVAKTPHSQCRGFIPGQGTRPHMLHLRVQMSELKTPHGNKDQRVCVPQLRSGTAKQKNQIKKKNSFSDRTEIWSPSLYGLKEP